MPTLKIDGHEITVEKDTLIIEACRQLGIYVPHFCYHPGLSVAGQCRLCLVEIKGQPKMLPSCQQTCADGMEVTATSDRVRELRRAMMELHLINHPVDCPICDKAGECTLQDYYMAYDLGSSRLDFRKVGKNKVVPIGPRVMYDGERCVMCTRCVRFTHEVSRSGQLCVAARGDRSYISTLPSRELTDLYSLCTVDLCPVGALTSRDFRFQRRVWFMKAHPSVCPGCATGCNVEVHEAEGKCHRIMPRVNMAVNRYWMCDDGRMTYHEVQKERTTPTGGTLAGAIASAANRLSALVQGGAGSLGVVLSPRATNEENYALARFAAEYLGTGSIYVGAGRPAWLSDDFLRHADNNPNRAGADAIRQWAVATQGAPGAAARMLKNDLEQGLLRALIVLGPDWPVPLLGGVAPDSNAQTLLARLDLLVVISPQHSTLTELAHVVLPQAHPFELEGTFTNAKGMTQRLYQVVRPVGEAQPAWRLVSLLAQKLDLALDYPDARAVFDELASRVGPLNLSDPQAAAAAWGPRLQPRVISSSPIHEAPEVPFDQMVSHQSPVAAPVPTYAGYRK